MKQVAILLCCELAQEPTIRVGASRTEVGVLLELLRK